MRMLPTDKFIYSVTQIEYRLIAANNDSCLAMQPHIPIGDIHFCHDELGIPVYILGATHDQLTKTEG